MILHKTSLARDTLQHNGSALSQHERRILILCDGRRSTHTIVEMLGADAIAALQILQQQGYLAAGVVQQSVTQVPPNHALTSVAGKWLGRLRNAASVAQPAASSTTSLPDTTPPHAQDPVAAPTSHATVSVVASNDHPASTTAAPRGTRRSLPAAKMYMLDMLQLQRSMEASSLAVSIQTSTTEGHLVWTMLEALRHLHATTKDSVCARIAQRLKEVIPETYLDALETTWNDLLRPAQWCEPAAAPSNIIPIERYAS